MSDPRPPRHRGVRAAGPLLLVALLAVAPAACSSDGSDGSATTTTAADAGSSTTAPASDGPAEAIVFNGQGNNLDAYATTPDADGTFATQRVFETVDTDPEHGRDLNAQLCFLPRTDDGEQWLIGGEDTGQDDPTRPPGWGIFRLEGGAVGELEATQIGKLVPTFQPANDNPENYGCGVLPDGRVLTTDVGNQASGSGDGQLILWFPPLTGGEYPTFDDVAYCKLDVTLPTGQSILVGEGGDTVYVAAARGDVYAYAVDSFPTSPDAAGGCGEADATGAPMADDVARTTFIPAGDHGLATPAGLAHAPDGGFYVSSVFTGVINEYDADGQFVRTILQPPAGEAPGAEPLSTGSPLGIGVDDTGTLYYADIGIVVSDDGVGPGDETGSVRRIRFVDGEPQAPEVMAEPLAFPDGIGVWLPAG
ncbi:MAG: hypothetical protein R2746_03600 [Acidimicrobiales bacterium]